MKEQSRLEPDSIANKKIIMKKTNDTRLDEYKQKRKEVDGRHRQWKKDFSQAQNDWRAEADPNKKELLKKRMDKLFEENSKFRIEYTGLLDELEELID